MSVELVRVKEIDDGMRLNRWFMKYYPKLSLGHLQKLLRTKQIKVDGARAECALRLSMGQEVRIPPLNLDDEFTENKKVGVSKKDAEFIINMVIYKDDNIIVLNKPSGVAVQGGTNTTFHIDGMLEALQFEYDESPKLVHRIDKDTSGILVLARNRKNAELLTQAFKERDLHKTYLALVKGAPAKDSGEIKANLEKSGEKSFVDEDGKVAITTYKVLDKVGERFSLVEACPQTGRTHQIRAHMEHLGCPIVGDDKYFGEQRQRFNILADKLYLHAYKIDLSSIYSNLVIKAKLPAHFVEAFTSLGIKFKE